jgi:hypothetical protein
MARLCTFPIAPKCGLIRKRGLNEKPRHYHNRNIGICNYVDRFIFLFSFLLRGDAMSLFKRIKTFFAKDDLPISDHKMRIVQLLKKDWHTQMDCAKMGLTLNLSKRLCELEIELAPKWKVERRWKESGKHKCKEYRIVRA